METVVVEEKKQLNKSVDAYKVAITIFNIVFAVAGIILVIPFFGVGIMMFDEPGTHRNPQIIFQFFMFTAIPLSTIPAIPISQLLFKKGKHNYALIASLLPAILGALFFLSVATLDMGTWAPFFICVLLAIFLPVALIKYKRSKATK